MRQILRDRRSLVVLLFVRRSSSGLRLRAQLGHQARGLAVGTATVAASRSLISAFVNSGSSIVADIRVGQIELITRVGTGHRGHPVRLQRDLLAGQTVPVRVLLDATMPTRRRR